jgi:ABC-type sugar transport system permease subunit/ABC-type glycerol-3-phosphate transport system substrate-binding protein
MRISSQLLRLALLFVLAPLLLAVPAHAEDLVLNVFAQAYTPGIKTGDNPRPLHEFTRIAKEFEALHPGVRIQFIKNPVGDFRTWMRTQLQGDMAPDVMWTHSDYANEDAKYGWFLNLDPYLAQPNPYCPPGTPGSKRWVDQFYRDATNAKRSPDGHLYSLPIDQVGTAFFYNKDLFERVGVTQPPKTWREFLEIQKKLKAAGIIPFLMTVKEPMRLQWTRGVLLDQLFEDVMPQMDVRSIGVAGGPGVDAQEFVRAYKKGIFSVRDPRYRETLRLIKEWSQYWQMGALAANDDRLFRLGKAAMWWDGSWYVPQIERDPLRKFRYGIFLPPRLTKEDSPYATGDGVRGLVSAASIQYAISNTAMKDPRRKELSIDFLRFLTAPQNLGPLVAEAALFIPNVPGLEGSPLLKPFMEVMDSGASRFGAEAAGARYTDQMFRVHQEFLGGRLTEEQTIARLGKYLERGVEQTLRDNADAWRFDSNWEILPEPTAKTKTADKPAPPWAVLAGAGVAVLGGLAVALSRKEVRKAYRSYLFIAPTFFLLLVFSYYPIFSALGHSFTEWKGSGASTWIGLANFRELFADDVMGEASLNTLKMLIGGMIISLTAPLIAAEMIFALKSERAQYLYRVFFVIPMVVPGVVTLLIWGFIYDDNLGLLNQALTAVGLGGLRQSWLGEPNTALYSLILMGFPWVGGFALLIYYAGLQNIPGEVFESARLDGASGFTRFQAIDLPLLMGQIKLLVVLGFIGGLQGFQTQLLLTNGGPGYATTVPGMHLYQNAMSFDRMGYACAIGVVLFLVILSVTYLNLKYMKSSSEYQP